MSENLAPAALSFESVQIVLSGKATDRTVSGVAKFKNTGNSSIALKSVEAVCNCTTPSFEKRTYAPGESGEIRVTVTTLDEGRSFRTLKVTTDEAGGTSYGIVVETNIGILARLGSTRAYWAAGSAPDEIVITIDSLVEEPIRVLRVATGRTDFVVITVKEIKPGNQFALVIKPITTRRPFDDRIDVILGTTTGVSRGYTLYARGD